MRPDDRRPGLSPAMLRNLLVILLAAGIVGALAWACSAS
jgi:hypothetical protein